MTMQMALFVVPFWPPAAILPATRRWDFLKALGDSFFQLRPEGSLAHPDRPEAELNIDSSGGHYFVAVREKKRAVFMCINAHKQIFNSF